jgi:hypothetical protein
MILQIPHELRGMGQIFLIPHIEETNMPAIVVSQFTASIISGPKKGSSPMKIRDKSRLFSLIINIMIILAIPGYSQEADNRWLYVTASKDETQVYQDRIYNELPNGNRTIWEKFLDKTGFYTLQLSEYNCKQRKARILEVYRYNPQGNVVLSGDGSTEWRTPIPDSVGEASYENVCSIENHAPTAPPTNYRRERQATPYSPKGDIGVDYGIVTSARANLREGPGTDYAAFLGIPKGDMVALLGGGDDSGWYETIHVKSNTEGFIHGSTISVYLTQNPKPPMTIQGYYAGGSGNPAVDVNNDTSKVMTLKMNEIRYVFSPGETRTLTLAPGRYLFHASAPNVIPDFGDQDFQTGHKYKWRFYIVTTRVRRR